MVCEGRATLIQVPTTGGKREPFGADRFETSASRPNIEPMGHRRRKRLENALSASDRLPSDRREVGCLIWRILGCQPQFTPKPATQARRPSGRLALSNKIPASLAPPWRTSFGHLSRKALVSGKDFAQRMDGRDASGKAEFRARCGGAGSIRSRLA